MSSRPSYDRCAAALLNDPERRKSMAEIRAEAQCGRDIYEEVLTDLIAAGRIARRGQRGQASLRTKVLAMLGDGYRQCDVARDLNVTRSYVNRIRREMETTQCN